ncbi:LysR family transcriptional regulator [Dickeya poaceiphila]|uniref:LysR family transcriptional regulator n=1 Tax=Dickeya poaceiphila TaxID=568768 RepID=A0A5B8I6H2_9GAMM|nr:LysR family transcriptional regulator [Dickeya poaceiphila]QDX28857.1 LysR family transcriptional regulator [Dickeya poaceiphila]
MFKQLQDMALFALVAECGSFTEAARQAGMAKSSLSLRVSQLEQSLGLRLFNRTTRKLNLTFAGERYLVHCREMRQASERAEMAMQHLRDNPSGRLRITSPAGLGATLLARLIAEFQSRFPVVSLDIVIADRVIDLVEEGFDVALRTGKPQDSSLIGRPLGRVSHYLVASVAYLAGFSPITHPRQLQSHRCIAHKAWPEWGFHREAEYFLWRLPQSHITDNLLYARACALAGGGITLLPAFLCREQIDSGELACLLPEWQADTNDLYLIYPGRRLNSPALNCFIDFALSFTASCDYSAP